MAARVIEPERYYQSGLDALASAIREDAKKAGLTRERGGFARNVWWVEMSGRLEDGAWVELRLHARPDGLFQAGMLLYQPLTRGGRTLELGNASRSGDGSARSAMQLKDDILKWIQSVVPKKKERKS
jgi:hypothetical protein